MRRVDVVVPVYRDETITLRALNAVLDHSGPLLGRLLVVNDRSPEPGMAWRLRALRERRDGVYLLDQPFNQGFVRSANLGLAAGRDDVVVLNSDTLVTPGWLDELVGALDSDERLAAVSPLSNNATFCSVPDFGYGGRVDEVPFERLELGGLPRVTPTPTGHGFCLLLRRAALDQVGLFDPAYGRGYNEENDWCQRVRARGWQVGRANRAFVYHHGEVSFSGARARLDVINARRLLGRYPRYYEENRHFEAGPHARLAARAVRCSLGRLEVGYEIRDAAEWPLVEALRRAFKVSVCVPELSPLMGDDVDVRCARPSGRPLREAALVALIDQSALAADEAELVPFVRAAQAVVAADDAVAQGLLARVPELQGKVVVSAPETLVAAVRRAVLQPDVSCFPTTPAA
jgi:GT2 family glycosyltransferase